MLFLIGTVVVCIFMTFATVKGEPNNKWPVEDCFRKDIDLVLLADASTQYRGQMRLFSSLVDAFSPQYETELDRLRITLLDIPFNLQANNRSLNVRIQTDTFTAKSDFKDALLNGSKLYGSLPLASSDANILSDAISRHKNHVTMRPSALHVFVAAASTVSVARWCQTASVHFMCRILSHEVFLLLFKCDGRDLLRSIANSVQHKAVVDLYSASGTAQVLSKICQPCADGWFPYESRSHSRAAGSFSCYYVGNTSSEINWMDASRRCEQLNAELVSLESKEELSFLSTKINVSQPPVDGKVHACIGLRREDNTLGRRFRWINRMPLIHTWWGPNHPQNGPTASCAVWTFVDSSAKNSSNLVPQDSAARSSNYWESTGCGFVNWKVYICEVNYRNEKNGHDSYVYEFKSRSPNNASIDKALERSQLVLTEDSRSYTSLTTVPSTTELVLAKANNSELVIDLANLPLLSCWDQAKIFYNFVCDLRFRCTPRPDLVKCHRPVCLEDEYRCKSGRCISKKYMCDLYKDCEDGDDELDCYSCQHARCLDGRCLPKHWFGDGEVDCDSCTEHDIENEVSASQDMNITTCIFICNRTKCVYEWMLNNGVVDCHGPEGPLDETLGALESTVCYEKGSSKYSNWAPKCVYIRDAFEEVVGCRNMKHLDDCQRFTCPEGYVKCPESYCIPFHYVHNSNFDCPNGEDESSSTLLQCPGYFICDEREDRQKICLHPDYVCDGQRHCPDGEDELDCNVKCLKGLICISGTVVVSDRDTEVDLSDIDPGIRFIDISGLNAPNVFVLRSNNRVTKLVEARFASCNIISLNFSSKFPVLSKLDLSNNHIEIIKSPSVLKNMPYLSILNLSRNTKLLSLHESAFRQNPIIEVLDLSFTSIQEVAFAKSFPCLKILILKNTPIAIQNLALSLQNKLLFELDLRGIKDDSIWPNLFESITIKFSLRVDNFKFCCRQLHNANTSLKDCKANADPFSSCSDLMTSTILRIILWTIGMFSVFGNAIVLGYRFAYDRKAFGTGYGHFVTHLGVSDFLMGLYLIAIASADMHYRGSYLWGEQHWRSSFVCKASGFLSTLSTEISIFFIFLITLDRFLVIRFPFGQVRIRKNVAILICVITWAIGITLALIPGLHYFGHWSVYTTTGVCVGLPFNPLADAAWLYSQSIFIYANFLLFLLIAFGQVVIYKTMEKMRIKESCLTNIGSRRLQDMTVAKNLLLVVVANFMCWFPVGVLGIMTLCGYQMDKDVYAWTAVLVLPVNSAINPVLYTVPNIVQKSREVKDKATRPSSLTTSL